MEPAVHIPISNALEALWYINDCFGFKYPMAIRALLVNSIYKEEYLCTPTITQDRISLLLDNILKLDRHENSLVHLVLWLNANINRPDQEVMSSTNEFQGSLSPSAHEKDLLNLRKWIDSVPSGEKVTLKVVGSNLSVTLENEHNWFLTVCDSWLSSDITPQDAKSRVSEMRERPGSKGNDEKLCVAYGVFRFLCDVKAINGERSSALLQFIWKYLEEMGLEKTPYDPNKTGSLNTNLGRYDDRYRAGSQKSNFHFPKLQFLSIPKEVLSALYIK